MGAYGPMRKLFMAEEVKIVRGGAILPRFGHASFKRGLEREFQKFLTKIGCPILLTVHGTASARWRRCSCRWPTTPGSAA